MAIHSPIKMVSIMFNSKKVPRKNPEKKGMKNAESEMTIFLPFKDLMMPSKLISRPAIIINRKIPSSEIIFISSLLWITFNIVGPRIIPAKISPIIAGCLKRSMISPKNLANTNNSNRLAKKGNSIEWTLNSIFFKNKGFKITPNIGK